MFLTNLSRIDLLHLLPKGGEAAEIGVAEGTFSRLILSHAAPTVLHLVDPWEHQDRADYESDGYGNPESMEQDARFAKVAQEFSAQISQGQVELHKMYSTTFAGTMADGQLDWAYLDGLHSQAGVAADLAAFENKLKPEGFLLGHDYTNHAPAQLAGFGVVEAVNAFVAKSDYTVLLMTMENFPTYVLTRQPQGSAAMALLAQVLYHSSWLVEIEPYPSSFSFTHKTVTLNGKSIAFPCFSPQTDTPRRECEHVTE